MPCVFRPNLFAWLWCNPVALAAAALLLPLAVIDRLSSPALLIALAVFTAIVLIAVVRASASFIAIDNRQISGRFMGRTFRVLWWDVRAAWLDTHSEGNPVLMLGTEQHLFGIPLRYMDAAKIWNLAQPLVNPSALQEKARQALPYWQPVTLSQIPDLKQPLVLQGRRLEKAVGWAGVILFGGMLLASIPLMNVGLALVMVGFTLFSCCYLLSAYYTLQVGPTGIVHQMAFGHYFISWEELRSVRIAHDGSTVLFQAGEKQILIYGPKTWPKACREDAMQYIGLQLEVRQIHVKVDPWLGLRVAFSNRAARIKNPPQKA
jgi:hypothetical protein